MATVSASLSLISGGGNFVGPNVLVGDTITLTVSSSNAVSGTSVATKSNTSGCAAINVVVGTATANAITTFSGSAYAVTYSYSSDGTVTFARTLTGNVGAASDNTPNAFDLPDVSNAVPDTLIYSTAQTIGGMDTNTQCSVAGDGSPQLQVAGGAWVTSSTISPNQTINVRLTSSTSFSTPHIATLTIGTVTDTITVTTSGAPASGTGGEISAGTSAYGIKIYDTNGTTSVLSPGTRYMTRLTDPASVSIAPNGGSVLIPCNMAGSTSSNSNIVVVNTGSTANSTSVTLESNGFRITNNSTATYNNFVYAVRF